MPVIVLRGYRVTDPVASKKRLRSVSKNNEDCEAATEVENQDPNVANGIGSAKAKHGKRKGTGSAAGNARKKAKAAPKVPRCSGLSQ